MTTKSLKIKKIEKTFLIKLGIIASVLILIASIEALFNAKSEELWKAYQSQFPTHEFGDYLSIVTTNYFMTILEVTLITLFSFFTVNKFGISRIFKIVFILIIFMRFVNYLLSFRTNSIFYYLILLLYILFMAIIATTKTTKRKINHGIF